MIIIHFLLGLPRAIQRDYLKISYKNGDELGEASIDCRISESELQKLQDAILG